MYKCFKYRLYPSKQQEEKLNRVLSLCCRVYNLFIEQRKDEQFHLEALPYPPLDKKKIKQIHRFDQQGQLPGLKIQWPELKEVYSSALVDIPKRIEEGYQLFYKALKQKGRFVSPPTFKRWENYNSFTQQAGFKYQKSVKSKLECIGQLKVKSKLLP